MSDEYYSGSEWKITKSRKIGIILYLSLLSTLLIPAILLLLHVLPLLDGEGLFYWLIVVILLIIGVILGIYNALEFYDNGVKRVSIEHNQRRETT